MKFHIRFLSTKGGEAKLSEDNFIYTTVKSEEVIMFGSVPDLAVESDFHDCSFRLILNLLYLQIFSYGKFRAISK